MNFKDIVRETLIFFRIDLTQNLKYDRLTKAIMQQKLQANSNCVDVGCHKGEMLKLMLKYAPNGIHFAFEPIPEMFHNLSEKFKGEAKIFPYALAETSGITTFQFVKNAPAYSGIRKRKYAIENPDIEEITVAVKSLDEVLAAETKIDFVKIDVEGGEFGVLKGAREILKANKPYILFECGQGASEFYGTKPEDLHAFLENEIGVHIYTLKAFLKGRHPLKSADFVQCFNSNSEYYFIAALSSK